jgi:hypothetical protein
LQIEENAGDLPSSGSKALKKKVSIRSKSLHLLANIWKTIIDRERLLLAEIVFEILISQKLQFDPYVDLCSILAVAAMFFGRR